jgi:hypothetical protein
VVKKGDTVKASTLVNSLFTLEEFMHMINVSVNSKYGADLEGITHTLMDSVRGSVEYLRLEFKQESEKLPRQIRAMVQWVLGETRGKHDVDAPDVNATSTSANEAATLRPQTNPNFPQPFY